MTNNAKAIIKYWKEKYKSTKNPYFAMCVFQVTGEYPDDLKSWGITVNFEKHDELEFINVPNMIY